MMSLQLCILDIAMLLQGNNVTPGMSIHISKKLEGGDNSHK